MLKGKYKNVRNGHIKIPHIFWKMCSRVIDIDVFIDWQVTG
jgi:hypothetical protein